MVLNKLYLFDKKDIVVDVPVVETKIDIAIRNCQHEGCDNPPQPRSMNCRLHCRRKRCIRVGCSKYANKTGFCKAHSNTDGDQHDHSQIKFKENDRLQVTATLGRRCRFSGGCTRYAQAAGFCVSHGGGKQCRYEGCIKNAQAGGLCRTHGGGKKCHRDGCTKYAHRGGLCVSHGGGKRCGFEGCSKTAQTGGFCVAHGGGKRCGYNECSRLVFREGLCRFHGSKQCAKKECKLMAVADGHCALHNVKPLDAHSLREMTSPHEKSLLQIEGGTANPFSLELSAWSCHAANDVDVKARMCKELGCRRYAKYQGSCLQHASSRQRMALDRICP